MLFDVSTNTQCQVIGGIINFHFPKFEKVLHALVSHDASVNTSGDMSGSIDISYAVGADASANSDVNVFAYISSQPATFVRRAATTADLAGKRFTVVAFGE